MIDCMPGFAGETVTPADARYDELRLVWNAMHDRRPAMIARCTSTEDVVAAIAFARANHLVIAVRSGGHSLPGFGVCDDGLVIDLRLLNRVSVAPAARRAVVQGGALLADVDRATQQHGLVVPAGVVSHTGIGGLALGGGVGRLMRRFGLTIDSLLSAEVVTADGRALRAAEDENADLFWAIRGGGGNFGVVTRFEFALHELSVLPILTAFHELDDAPELLRRARKAMSRDAPDELVWTSFVRKALPMPWVPPELVGRPGVMSVIEWSGDPETGRTLLGAVRAEIQPAASSLDLVPFLQIQTIGDEASAHGLLYYLKATFADDLTDDLIDVLVASGRLLRSELSQVDILPMGGAIRRVPPDATAFPHRDASWLINVPASWRTPAESDYEIGWVRDTFAALRPVTAAGTYVNLMDSDEAARNERAYGSALRRLRAVKAVYDPDNIFQLNQNIVPAAAS